MTFRKTYGEFLFEKKSDSYSKGCAMIYFDFPDMEGFHEMIDEEDLYTEEGDRSYGIEDEPHITLLYGLNNNVSSANVFEILNNFKVDKIKLTEVTAFKNEKFDVLKWDVECETLFEINKELVKLPHKNDFPDYHPHATIAYLKSGTADKYIEKMKAMSYTVKPTVYVYSMANGTVNRESI